MRSLLRWLPLSLFGGALLMAFQNCSRVDFQAEEQFYRNQNLLTDEYGRPIPYYGNMKIGDNSQGLPLKIVFVIDNSTSAGIANAQDAFNHLFPTNFQGSDLEGHDVTLYFITTHQLNGSANLGYNPSQGSPFNVFLQNNLILGISWGFSLESLTSQGSTSVYQYGVAPVISQGNGQVAAMFKPANPSTSTYSQFLNEGLNRLAMIPSGATSGNGLCALSRLMKKSSTYFQKTDIVWLSIFSDQNDQTLQQESECVDQLTVAPSTDPYANVICSKPMTDFAWGVRHPGCEVTYQKDNLAISTQTYLDSNSVMSPSTCSMLESFFAAHPGGSISWARDSNQLLQLSWINGGSITSQDQTQLSTATQRLWGDICAQSQNGNYVDICSSLKLTGFRFLNATNLDSSLAQITTVKDVLGSLSCGTNRSTLTSDQISALNINSMVNGTTLSNYLYNAYGTATGLSVLWTQASNQQSLFQQYSCTGSGAYSWNTCLQNANNAASSTNWTVFSPSFGCMAYQHADTQTSGPYLSSVIAATSNKDSFCSGAGFHYQKSLTIPATGCGS